MLSAHGLSKTLGLLGAVLAHEQVTLRGRLFSRWLVAPALF
jgi:hypothetical protein